MQLFYKQLLYLTNVNFVDTSLSCFETDSVFVEMSAVSTNTLKEDIFKVVTITNIKNVKFFNA